MTSPKNPIDEAAKTLQEDGVAYFEKRMGKRLRRAADPPRPVSFPDEEPTGVRTEPLPVRKQAGGR